MNDNSILSRITDTNKTEFQAECTLIILQYGDS